MQNRALDHCKFVKTILMVLVIIGHACAFWTGNWFSEKPIFRSDSLSMLNSWFNHFHVFAFALVSGYIFACKILGGGV